MKWDRFKKFDDTSGYNPLHWLKPMIDPQSGDMTNGYVRMHRLRTLILKNYFERNFITEIVKENRDNL